MRDKELIRLAVASMAGFVLVLLMGACSWLPTGPTTTQTVIVSQNQNPTPGPSPSPSPGTEGCNPTSIVLGVGGDDFILQAGGEDSVILVPSFYQNLFELPEVCTATLSPVYTATGTAGCTISGKEVRAANAGSCSITAKLPAIPASNAVDLTVTP